MGAEMRHYPAGGPRRLSGGSEAANWVRRCNLCGRFMSSAAVSRAPRRRGRSRAAAYPCVLHEMRPTRSTAAHKTDAVRRAGLFELVPLRRCRRQRHRSAACRNAPARLAGHAHRRPAQAAGRQRTRRRSRRLCRGDHRGARSRAADRNRPRGNCRAARRTGTASIIATGPLTSPALADTIRALTGEDALAFFDAIAPIVHRDSIDFDIAWFQSRYDKAGPGGIRRRLHQLSADARTIRRLHRCVARRREDRVPRFRSDDALFRRLPADRSDGRARPRDAAPRADEAVRPHQSASAAKSSPMPWCNCARTTSSARCSTWSASRPSSKHAEQVRVFRTIPGLAKAEFARLGGLHRNTFLNSPKLLDATLRLKAMPRLRFAGQITGCEGYVESAAIGLLAGRFAAAERLGRDRL